MTSPLPLLRGGALSCALLLAAASPSLAQGDCAAAAGTLAADDPEVTLAGAPAELSATRTAEAAVPEGYELLYVLTAGEDLAVSNVSAQPTFEVERAGTYRIHTLVAEVTDTDSDDYLDPTFVLPGETTASEVLAAVEDAGICAALDVTGAAFRVVGDDLCVADAGTLTADADAVALDGGSAALAASVADAATVPDGYANVYVLTSGEGLVLEAVAAEPRFDVGDVGTYRIHSLVAQLDDPEGDDYLDADRVAFGRTTAAEVLALVQLEGICASLDVDGARFDVEEGGECLADGGAIAFADGSTEVTIDLDDDPAPLDIDTDGTAVGGRVAWVITDADGEILSLPSSPPFDLSGAGPGTCLIWYLAFEGSLRGVAAGNNASDITGCYDLSNPLTVVREGDPDADCDADGGVIAFADGSTETAIVVDGDPDPLDVVFAEAPGGSNGGWVITDADLEILGLPGAPPFDLDGAGVGTCLIWHLAFGGDLANAQIGANAADLGGCFDFSNPLTVVRRLPGDDDGGDDDGGDDADCAAAAARLVPTGNPTVALDGAAAVLTAATSTPASVPAEYEQVYVLTASDDLVVVGLGPEPSFTVEVGGVYRIHSLVAELSDPASDDFLDAAVVVPGETTGADVLALIARTGACASLDPIGARFNVLANSLADSAVLTGGVTTTAGDSTVYLCPGDAAPVDVQFNYPTPTGEVALAVTDSAFNIIGLPDGLSVDLADAPEGTCYIFGFNYVGDVTAELGESVFATRFASESFLISQRPVQVVRATPEGGTVATAAGATEALVCVDSGSDVIAFASRGASAARFAYVITDDANVVLGVNTRGYADFNDAAAGTCRVWGLSYTGELTAAPGDDAAAVALSDGCFDLSDDFVTVVRASIDGGELSSGQADAAGEIVLDGGDAGITYATSKSGTADYAYFVLDETQRVAAVTPDESYDFSALDAGKYFVYGVSYVGEVVLENGDLFWGNPVATGCSERSGNALVVKYDPLVGERFAVDAVQDGPHSLRVSIAARDGDADPLTLQVANSFGTVIYSRANLTPGDVQRLPIVLPTASAGVHVLSVVRRGVVVSERFVFE